MRTSVSCWILIASCVIIFSDQDRMSAGEIYRYVDKHGVAHYTNVPQSKHYKPVELAPLSTPEEEGLTFSTAEVQRIERKPLKLRSRQRKRRWYSSTGSNSGFDQHIRHAARVHRIDPLLIKAIIKTESGFNRYAVSPKGAQGLMQLMPATAKDLKVKDPFDPWENISGGTRYIKWLLKRFNGNLRLSLAAYNAGPARVEQQKGIPRIPETVAYVGKVIRQYKAYKKTAASLKYADVPLATNIRVRQMVTVN